jgi:multidrug resistance efflux pump
MKIRFHRESRQSSTEVGGIKVPYAPARRLVSRWRWYLILVVVVSPLAALVIGVTGRSVSLVADGQLVVERFELRAATAGYVTQVNVAPQSRVSAGAVVVRLSDPAIASSEARLRATLDAPAGKPDVTGGLAMVERELAFQRRRMQAIDELFRAGAATAAEVGEATAALQRAEEAAIDRRSAAALHALARTTSAREQREVMAQLAALQRQRERLTARSPGSGRVLEVYVTPGEYVSAGSRLVAIGNTSLPTIEAYVEPRMIGGFAPGSPATVRFPDGTRVRASVQALPATVAAQPAAALERPGKASVAVQLVVADDAELPRAVRVDGLPVRVRFPYPWESTPAGRIVGRALAWLSGYG